MYTCTGLSSPGKFCLPSLACALERNAKQVGSTVFTSSIDQKERRYSNASSRSGVRSIKLASLRSLMFRLVEVTIDEDGDWIYKKERFQKVLLLLQM